MAWRQTLARWLDPDLAKHAERHRQIKSALDDARWWLGAEFPEAAALADWVLERDYWWATSKRFQERRAWTAPAWVISISDFREWLRSKRKAA